jgi:hypothetical protein
MYRLKLPNHTDDFIHLERKNLRSILASIFINLFFLVLFSIATNVLLSIGITHELATIPIAFILFSLSFPNLIKKNTLPQIITFDQKLRKIILRDTVHTPFANAPALSYDQVQSFDIQKKIATHTNSQGVRSKNTSWHIVLLKKDGVQWFLLTFRSKTKAEKQLLILQQAIHFDKIIDLNKIRQKKTTQWSITHKSFSLAGINQERFECQRNHDEVSISWVKKISLKRIIARQVVLLGNILLCIGLYQVGGEFGIFGMIILSIILVISILVIIRNSKKGWVKINSQTFMATSSQNILRPTQNIEMPLSSLYAVSFRLEHNTYLAVMDQSTHRAIQDAQNEMQTGKLGQAFTYIQLVTRMKYIDTTTLTASDILTLELLIQKFALELADHEVL